MIQPQKRTELIFGNFKILNNYFVTFLNKKMLLKWRSNTLKI
jgi:hypothetical protein